MATSSQGHMVVLFQEPSKYKKKRDVKGAYMTASRSRAAVSVLGGGPVLRTCSETGAELSVFGNLSVSFKMTRYPSA